MASKLLFLIPSLVLAWTLTFTEPSCLSGSFLESDDGVDIYTKPPGASCVSGGGIRFDQCGGLQYGGPFIKNTRTMNLSFEIEFSVPQRPFPAELGIFSLVDGDRLLEFFTGYDYTLNTTDGSAESLLRSPHYFAVRASNLITRTGYCNRITGTSNFIPFMNSNYQAILANLTGNVSDIYRAKFLFFGTPDDPRVPFTGVYLSNSFRSGTAFAPTNLGLDGSVTTYNYTVGGDRALYELGCRNGTSPGIVLYSFSVNQNTPIYV